MAKSRFVVALSWLVCVLFLPLIVVQGQTSQTLEVKSDGNVPGHDLKLVTIGHGTLSSGHLMAFRIYAATDGTKGQVIYAQFASLQEAQQQIEGWLKLTSKITSRDHDKGKGTQEISDRIVAQGREANSNKKKFLIIRRDGLNCYLIDSASLQVATQVEDLIKHM